MVALAFTVAYNNNNNYTITRGAVDCAPIQNEFATLH